MIIRERSLWGRIVYAPRLMVCHYRLHRAFVSRWGAFVFAWRSGLRLIRGV